MNDFFSEHTLARIKPNPRRIFGYAIELMDSTPGWSAEDAASAFDVTFGAETALAALGREVVHGAWALGRPTPLRHPHVRPVEARGRKHSIPEDDLAALHARWVALKVVVQQMRNDLPNAAAVRAIVERLPALERERAVRGRVDLVTTAVCFLYPFLRPWEVRYLRDKAPVGLPRSSLHRASTILFDRLRETHGAPASLRSMLAVQTQPIDGPRLPVFQGPQGHALQVNPRRNSDTPRLRIRYA